MLLKLIKIAQVAFLILYLCIFLLCLSLELVVSFFIVIKISEGLRSQICSSLQMLSGKFSAAGSLLMHLLTNLLHLNSRRQGR